MNGVAVYRALELVTSKLSRQLATLLRKFQRLIKSGAMIIAGDLPVTGELVRRLREDGCREGN